MPSSSTCNEACYAGHVSVKRTKTHTLHSPGLLAQTWWHTSVCDALDNLTEARSARHFYETLFQGIRIPFCTTFSLAQRVIFKSFTQFHGIRTLSVLVIRATPPKNEARRVPPSGLGFSNGGGAPGAARLLPRPVSRRDLPKYPC